MNALHFNRPVDVVTASFITMYLTDRQAANFGGCAELDTRNYVLYAAKVIPIAVWFNDTVLVRTPFRPNKTVEPFVAQLRRTANQRIVDIAKLVDSTSDVLLGVPVLTMPWELGSDEERHREVIQAYYLRYKQAYDKGHPASAATAGKIRTDLYKYCDTYGIGRPVL